MVVETKTEGLTANEFREFIRSDFKGYEVTVDPVKSLKTMLHIAPTVAKWYAGMKWTIFKIPRECGLCTSDNPVLKRNSNPDKSTFYGSTVGLANRFVEVWFPIAPTTLLTFTHDVKKMEEHQRLLETGQIDEAKKTMRPETEFPPGEIRGDLARRICERIIGNAHRYVYSSVRSQAIVDTLKHPSTALRWG
jgi:hypothetical protein